MLVVKADAPDPVDMRYRADLGHPMGIMHVIAGLAPEDGGPSYSVPRLCESRAEINGTEVTLLTVAHGAQPPSNCGMGGYRRRSFTQSFAGARLLNSLRVSRSLDAALAQGVPQVDVVHNHGLWLAPNIRSGWAARKAGRPLVISPRGMLSPAARSFSRRRKALAWALAQGAVVRGAACLHATSEAEYGEIRATGLGDPVAVIANGVDLPDPPAQRAARQDGQRTVLFLGRVHPKKGLDRLVRAWAAVEDAHGDWRRRIAGLAEDGHDAQIRALAAGLGLNRVSVEGPVFGEARSDAYRAADLFVLPSLNENFGLTVAEALAFGVPAISTTGAPWRGLAAERCGWWIPHGPDALAATLDEAMTSPPQDLVAMGARGRAWMERDFSWRRVAHDMAGVHSWLVSGGAAPASVRLT